MSESKKDRFGCFVVIGVFIILGIIESVVFSILDLFLTPVQLIADLVGEDLFLLVWIPLIIIGFMIYEWFD